MMKLIGNGVNLAGEGAFWLLLAALFFVNLPIVISIGVSAILYHKLDIGERAVIGIVGTGCGLWLIWIAFLLQVIPK